MSRYKMTLIPCSTDDRKVVNRAKFRNTEVAFSPYGRCILSGSSYSHQLHYTHSTHSIHKRICVGISGLSILTKNQLQRGGSSNETISITFVRLLGVSNC